MLSITYLFLVLGGSAVDGPLQIASFGSAPRPGFCDRIDICLSNRYDIAAVQVYAIALDDCRSHVEVTHRLYHVDLEGVGELLPRKLEITRVVSFETVSSIYSWNSHSIVRHKGQYETALFIILPFSKVNRAFACGLKPMPCTLLSC